MDYVEQINAAIEADDIDRLRGLVAVVGGLPENGAGTIQGWHLNAAYARACDFLEV